MLPSSSQRFKSHGPNGPSSHLVSRYLALAAATSLGLTPSGLHVFLPRASRHVSRIGCHLSRLVRRGDDRDTRRPSSQCLGQELGHFGKVVHCRTLCFSNTVLVNLGELALAAATSLEQTPSGLPVVLTRASRHVSRIGRHRSRLIRRLVMIVTLAVRAVNACAKSWSVSEKSLVAACSVSRLLVTWRAVE